MVLSPVVYIYRAHTAKGVDIAAVPPKLFMLLSMPAPAGIAQPPIVDRYRRRRDLQPVSVTCQNLGQNHPTPQSPTRCIFCYPPTNRVHHRKRTETEQWAATWHGSSWRGSSAPRTWKVHTRAPPIPRCLILTQRTRFGMGH